MIVGLLRIKNFFLNRGNLFTATTFFYSCFLKRDKKYQFDTRKSVDESSNFSTKTKTSEQIKTRTYILKQKSSNQKNFKVNFLAEFVF